jgi:hypothetical protein
MKIGIVVHGPEIVDSGYAEIIMELLRKYGEVKARLGGTMGRTAVIDADLEDQVDISQKLLPSQSIDKFSQEQYDVIFLMNSGKSSITGHTFGCKVSRRSRGNPPLIQIERPGKADGTVVPWYSDLKDFAEEISKQLDLKVVMPPEILGNIIEKTRCTKKYQEVRRRVAGVSPDENIFVNGIVVGRSTSSDVTLVAIRGIITDIVGGKLKKHGVEKLGKIDLENAIVKTGLLRRSRVEPRMVESKKHNSKFRVSYLNHAAEDIYRLKNADMVVTVGDDTTLVAADILYRFNVPIIGITDGDLDKVVENGFKAGGSLIVELESGWDDFVGEKIFFEIFNGKETIEIENIENFKSELIQIINKTTSCYNIKYN